MHKMKCIHECNTTGKPNERDAFSPNTPLHPNHPTNQHNPLTRSCSMPWRSPPPPASASGPPPPPPCAPVRPCARRGQGPSATVNVYSKVRISRRAAVDQDSACTNGRSVSGTIGTHTSIHDNTPTNTQNTHSTHRRDLRGVRLHAADRLEAQDAVALRHLHPVAEVLDSLRVAVLVYVLRFVVVGWGGRAGWSYKVRDRPVANRPNVPTSHVDRSIDRSIGTHSNDRPSRSINAQPNDPLQHTRIRTSSSPRPPW